MMTYFGDKTTSFCVHQRISSFHAWMFEINLSTTSFSKLSIELLITMPQRRKSVGGRSERPSPQQDDSLSNEPVYVEGHESNHEEQLVQARSRSRSRSRSRISTQPLQRRRSESLHRRMQHTRNDWLLGPRPPLNERRFRSSLPDAEETRLRLIRERERVRQLQRKMEVLNCELKAQERRICAIKFELDEEERRICTLILESYIYDTVPPQSQNLFVNE